MHLSTLSCAVSLSVKLFSSPPSRAVCAEWEGDGDVDYGVFDTECAVERQPSLEDVSGRHHQSRAELGPMPTWVVRMVAGVVLGSGRVLAGYRERVGPCLMSSRMLTQGLLGWC